MNVLSREMRSRTQMQRNLGFLITKLNKRTKTTPKGKNKQAGRRLEHSQTFNSHDMDTRKTTDQNRTADTRRLYRETNEGNEGDTAGATETMISNKMGGDRQSTWEHMAPNKQQAMCSTHRDTGGQPGHTSRTVTCTALSPPLIPRLRCP